MMFKAAVVAGALVAAAGVLGAAPASAGTDIPWFSPDPGQSGKARFLSAQDAVEVCDLKADGYDTEVTLFRDPDDFYTSGPYIKLRALDGSSTCLKAAKDIVEGKRVVVYVAKKKGDTAAVNAWRGGYA